jgi:hypothetical protein
MFENLTTTSEMLREQMLSATVVLSRPIVRLARLALQHAELYYICAEHFYAFRHYVLSACGLEPAPKTVVSDIYEYFYGKERERHCVMISDLSVIMREHYEILGDATEAIANVCDVFYENIFFNLMLASLTIIILLHRVVVYAAGKYAVDKTTPYAVTALLYFMRYPIKFILWVTSWVVYAIATQTVGFGFVTLTNIATSIHAAFLFIKYTPSMLNASLSSSVLQPMHKALVYTALEPSGTIRRERYFEETSLTFVESDKPKFTVHLYRLDGSDHIFLGSAFLVQAKLPYSIDAEQRRKKVLCLVTARHVVSINSENELYNVRDLCVGILQTGTKEDKVYPLLSFKATVLFELPENRHDIAAFTVSSDLPSVLGVKIITIDVEARRTPVSKQVSIETPSRLIMVNNTALRFRQSCVTFQGSVREITVPTRETPGLLYYDASTVQGTSGAPVLSHDNKLLGVHIGYDSKKELNAGTLAAVLLSSIAVVLASRQDPDTVSDRVVELADRVRRSLLPTARRMPSDIIIDKEAWTEASTDGGKNPLVNVPKDSLDDMVIHGEQGQKFIRRQDFEQRIEDRAYDEHGDDEDKRRSKEDSLRKQYTEELFQNGIVITNKMSMAEVNRIRNAEGNLIRTGKQKGGGIRREGYEDDLPVIHASQMTDFAREHLRQTLSARAKAQEEQRKRQAPGGNISTSLMEPYEDPVTEFAGVNFHSAGTAALQSTQTQATQLKTQLPMKAMGTNTTSSTIKEERNQSLTSLPTQRQVTNEVMKKKKATISDTQSRKDTPTQQRSTKRKYATTKRSLKHIQAQLSDIGKSLNQKQ